MCSLSAASCVARRLGRAPPAVVPAAGDLQQLAQPLHRMLALHDLDLGKPLPGVSERMPNDFFSTFSRSCIRPSSVRSRVISAVASSRGRGAPVSPPRSGREPVAPLVEQRFSHPQFIRHLPHGALAVQRQFDRLPLVVLVVLPARLVLVRLAFRPMAFLGLGVSLVGDLRPPTHEL